MRYQLYTLCLVLLLFSVFFCYSQEPQEYEPVPLRIIQPTDAWYAKEFIKLANKDLTINENMVLGVRNIHGSHDGTRINVYMNTILFQDERFYVYANSTIPFSSDTLFPEDWISDIVGWDRKIWIVSYLLDVLQSNDRNTLYKYEKNYIDALNNAIEYDPYFDGWWRYRVIGDCLVITQSGIAIGTFDNVGLWIINNKIIYGGHKITVQGDKDFMEMEYEQKGYLNPDIGIPGYSRIKQFDLLLIRDNDYMDVYLETLDNKLETFVLVEPEIVRALNLLLGNEPYINLINSWPRRADGSMDYPPPGTSTPSVPEEPKQPEVDELSVDTATESLPSAQNSSKTNVLPLWAWLAIGGAVVIAGAVVLVIRRRKG